MLPAISTPITVGAGSTVIANNLTETSPTVALGASQGPVLMALHVELHNMLRAMSEPNLITNPEYAEDQEAKGAVVFVNAVVSYIVDGMKCYGTTDNKISGTRDLDIATVKFSEFSHHVGFATTAAYTITTTSERFIAIVPIEDKKIAPLHWGTPKARPGKMAFSVIANNAGTYSGSIQNAAGGRSFPFLYTVAEAGVEQRFYIPITAETTSGAWDASPHCATVVFSAGCGTSFTGSAGEWASADLDAATGETKLVGISGAKLYITGIDFYPDDTITEDNPQGTNRPFPHKDDYLPECKRYWQKLGFAAFALLVYEQSPAAANNIYGSLTFPEMCAAPNATIIGTWGVENCGQPSVFGVSNNTITLQALATSAGTRAIAYTNGTDDGIILEKRL